MAQNWAQLRLCQGNWSQFHLGWVYAYELSRIKGGRLPCGGWLGVGSVAKIILRVWGSRGTPLRLRPAT